MLLVSIPPMRVVSPSGLLSASGGGTTFPLFLQLLSRGVKRGFNLLSA